MTKRIIIPGEPPKPRETFFGPAAQTAINREFLRMFRDDSVLRQFARVGELRASMPRPRD